jgi:hypothetical protein
MTNSNFKNFAPSPFPSLPAYRQAGAGERERVRENFKYLWLRKNIFPNLPNPPLLRGGKGGFMIFIVRG